MTPEIDEDEEIQRVLTESYKQQVPYLPVSPQKIEGIDDKDMEAAILMSMEIFNQPKKEESEKQPQNNEENHEDDTEIEDRELSDVLEQQIKMKEEKSQLNERRLHVREQDDAYETSLAMDRSKEEYRKELERIEIEKVEAQKRLETEKEKKNEERKSYLKKLEDSLPKEPESSDPNALHITFRLPNGDRFSRFFLKSSSFKQVKDFVDSRELYGKQIPSSYNFITDFPKQIWNMDLHLTDTNFQKRQLLRIEPK